MTEATTVSIARDLGYREERKLKGFLDSGLLTTPTTFSSQYIKRKH